jgi:hypothetical protein
MSEQEGRHSTEPDPEFVDRLEWQLRGEMRRAREFAARSRRRGWIRAAALVVLSVAIGFATATFAQQIEDREQARYLMMELEGRLDLANLRVQMLQEFALDQGTTDPDERRQLELQAQLAQWEMRRLALDYEEARATGAPPRDELTAPLVRGRDFVTERLEIELARTGDEHDRIGAVALRDRGDDGPGAAELRYRLGEIEEERRRLDHQIELRRQFLRGEVTAGQILRRTEGVEAENRLRAAQTRVRVLDDHRAYVEERVARGEEDARALRAVEYQRREALLELRLARFEARRLLREAGEERQ